MTMVDSRPVGSRWAEDECWSWVDNSAGLGCSSMSPAQWLASSSSVRWGFGSCGPGPLLLSGSGRRSGRRSDRDHGLACRTCHRRHSSLKSRLKYVFMKT